MHKDLAVRDAPPDILRSERGRTVTMPEAPDKIISRFVQEMLTNFSFLNNHMAKPKEVSAMMFYISLI